jgi:IclR family pca regulon transcriptional regulator
MTDEDGLDTSQDKSSHEFVQSLARGLSVIRAFGEDSPELTLSQVAKRTGLARTASRRFLLTLRELGYVRLNGRLFSLSPKILELGYSFLSSLPLSDLAVPYMKRLVEQIQESCSISVLDGDDVVYVARVPMNRIMSVQIHVGSRLPAYATSMGRVFLAYSDRDWLDSYLERTEITEFTAHTVRNIEQLIDALELVRVQGYSMVNQELELGLRSIAVPIWDGAGTRVIAAMNISAHASQRNEEFLINHALPALLTASRDIRATLGDSSGQGIGNSGRKTNHIDE